ncbi:DUF221-domain-containing protein [Viridothelium virens]|uniref:DUF221-domain-containing protein n=1 Tax=Viridothelium virens TaxID=1048519 RepID=A0A6A6HQS7_VIRVR|nr:DUF221-domain-containing protein [Viridothelium virens]
MSGNGDPNIGSSQDSSNNDPTASQLLSTLAPVALYAVIWLALFFVLRGRFLRYYQPRTFLSNVPDYFRTRPLDKGIFGSLKDFFRRSDEDILRKHSLDGYLLIRLLKMATITCVVGFCITAPVLFPVNATGGGGQTQLNVVNYSNVKNNQFRYFAHAGCAWLFFGFVIYMITRESIFYINLRQAYLMSPNQTQRIHSRTVLFTSVPENLLNRDKLAAMLGVGVKRIWIPTDTKELEEAVEERDKIALKLEGAENKLIKTANVNRSKAKKKTHVDEADGGESGSQIERWLPRKKQPHHRTGFLGLIGSKVETIPWCRSELEKVIPKVEKMQDEAFEGKGKRLSSVFVEFETMNEAQAAFQSVTHHLPLHMSPRFIGVKPKEVIWSNLRIKWWERVVRRLGANFAVTALIIFWSIPVAFVGAISNVQALTGISAFKWLNFLNDIPPVVLGVVNGLLPSILLAVLMALLPMFLRYMAKVSGDPSQSAIELSTQNYYFAFQVVQVFLVATIGSAASSSVVQIIKNPASVTSLLSQQIPKASNFYLSYIILQGLGVVAGTLVSITGLVVAFALAKILDTTPRKMYKRWSTLGSMGMGTVYPIYTNLLVIAMCYACIAPLVLAFAAIGLALFWLAYKYEFLFVMDVGADAKGLFYPRALQHLFVGLYIAELCLVGLFAIQLGHPGAIGPFIMMIIAVIFTALYNISLNSAISPLLQYHPKDLELLDSEEDGQPLLQNGERNIGGPEYDSVPGASASAKSGALETEKEGRVLSPQASTSKPAKKPNFFTKFLRPDIHANHKYMRSILPKTQSESPNTFPESFAYLHPSVKSRGVSLWVPHDPLGISRHEIRETDEVRARIDKQLPKLAPVSEVLNPHPDQQITDVESFWKHVSLIMFDSGAIMDENGKITGIQELGMAPIDDPEPDW